MAATRQTDGPSIVMVIPKEWLDKHEAMALLKVRKEKFKELDRAGLLGSKIRTSDYLNRGEPMWNIKDLLAYQRSLIGRKPKGLPVGMPKPQGKTRKAKSA